MIFLGRRSIRLSLPLLIGAMLVFANRAPASTDYSAGKTPEQLFDSDCSGCHHLPYRLAHGRNERSLTNFLREHYTTNARSAGSLASYLVRARASNSTVAATTKWFFRNSTEHMASSNRNFVVVERAPRQGIACPLKQSSRRSLGGRLAKLKDEPSSNKGDAALNQK
jgi:hypothetical protein